MIRAIAIDAAFANMGLARVEIEPGGLPGLPIIRCIDLRLISTEAEGSKQVRKSSDGLRRAQELHAGLQSFVRDAQFAFVEIPHGGALSAQAARAMGMAVGILASCPIPIIEVSPMEVKAAVVGKRKGAQPSKAEMMQWARGRWPDAPWLLGTVKGKKGTFLNSNEHLADALAAVVAGIATPEFQRVLALSASSNHYKHFAPENYVDASTPRRRPSSRRVPLL